MMTKKDYEAIAAAFKRELDKSYLIQSKGVIAAIIAFADVAEKDNPRFNRAKFYYACGMTAAD